MTSYVIIRDGTTIDHRQNIHQVGLGHAGRLKNGKQVEPSLLMLLYRIAGQIAIQGVADLTGDMQEARVFGGLDHLTVV